MIGNYLPFKQKQLWKQEKTAYILQHIYRVTHILMVFVWGLTYSVNDMDLICYKLMKKENWTKAARSSTGSREEDVKKIAKLSIIPRDILKVTSAEFRGLVSDQNKI